MTDTLTDVKRGLRDEINRLQNQISHLQNALAQVEGVGGTGSVSAAPAKRGPGRPPKTATAAAPVASDAATSTAVGGKRRGRPKGSKNVAKPAGSNDIEAAVRKIEEAGKDGIGARALQVALKKDGVAKPSKSELLATDKIKTKGFGGATSYVFNG